MVEWFDSLGWARIQGVIAIMFRGRSGSRLLNNSSAKDVPGPPIRKRLSVLAKPRVATPPANTASAVMEPTRW
jgi:hypothetical protein